jgi:hypothetical protein
MRLKGPDYPADQRDRARLVFFVPCGGGPALADLSIDHSRHALLTCCFLADHEVGQEWIVTQEVRRGIEAALGPRGDNPAAALAENEADEPLDPEIRAEVELAMADVREQIMRDGNKPTVGEVVRMTAKTRPDSPEAAIQRVATEILAAADNPAGSAARKAIQREIATRLRIDPKVKQAMSEAFAVVLEEFRDATLGDSAVLESVGRQVHGVTGGQMRKFAQRLRDAVPRPLTEDQILLWSDAHFQRTNQWPGQGAGPVHESPGDSWSLIDQCLRVGLRELKGGSSVAQLLQEHRGIRNGANLPPLTEKQILAWVDSHKERTGEWPNREAGEIAGSPGETWSGINQALSKGLRQLPGKSSLVKLLAKQRGFRNIRELPPLSFEQILGWADAHHERTGEWPTAYSGPINPATGETWAGVNSAIKNRRRNLDGHSSLADLLANERGIRNVANLRDLTEEKILQWADLHFQKTGEWPQVLSGPVFNAPGEDWRNVQAALVNGRRKLPGRSSLAQLLAEKRGVRNRGRLAPLTIEQILKWADIFFGRTKRWPDQFSGDVDDAPGEQWANIDQSLAKGLRELPGGSSLAQILSEHRGARNKKRPPALTVEQITAWAIEFHERTGGWPGQDSGEVEGVPGEKWRNIDQALRNGHRNLPGDSSLARLIKEHCEN